jgi:4-aminobutyrate aminotransferase-like enzyme
MFAVEHYGVQADVIVMAKGLGSASRSRDRRVRGADGEVAEGQPRRHVRRQPDRLRAALATIDVLTEPGFLDNVNARGEQLRAASPTSPATTAASSTCGAGADGRLAVQ